MNKMICIYPDREAAMIAYLYDDSTLGAAERVAFETHVASCEPCRTELAELRGVRATLGGWASPEPSRARSFEPRGASGSPRAWWHGVPVWAQVAAAMLVLGASASIANLNIRYDRNGLNVTTGWSRQAAATTTTPAVPVEKTDAAPWRAELTAMEQQLRSDMREQVKTVAAAPAPAPAASMTDAEFQRRVRVLLEESERRQQNELAVRLTQLQTDVNAQLRANLTRTNQLYRDVTNVYGGQILKQQQQINYLLPASQR